MKIGIITLPLKNNYGGLLQAYSLIKILQSLELEPELIYLKNENNDFKSICKESLKKYVLSFFIKRFSFYRYDKEVYKNTNYFIKKYISPKTKPIYNNKDLFNLEKSNFDAFIVGSDQVWRPKMNKFIESAFLNFVQDKRIKKLSYAASFGVNKWEYSEELTKRFKKDLSEFTEISIREDSGVELCKEYFGKDSIHLIDPTLLLNKDQYLELCKKENEPTFEKKLFTYILDTTNDKFEVINKVSNTLKLDSFNIHVNRITSNYDIKEKICPTVTSWIKAYIDAEYIVTDSFHGCVFSILFNKPFLVYGNKERGMARFNSILKLFGLENRLIYSVNELSEKKIKENINWENVNLILKEERKKSIDFLSRNLKGKI